MKTTNKNSDDQLRINALISSFRTRILVIGTPPPSDSSESQKRVVRPVIPPVPAPGDNKDEIIKYSDILGDILSSNAVVIKRKHFKPYIEMVPKEELVVRIIDGDSRKENQIIVVDTFARRESNISKFTKIKVNMELLEDNKIYIIIVKDKNSNLLHISFKLSS